MAFQVKGTFRVEAPVWDLMQRMVWLKLSISVGKDLEITMESLE